jgi:hypothetical protein
MKLPFVSRQEFEALERDVRALQVWAKAVQQQLAGGPPAPSAPPINPNLAGGPPTPP